MPRAQRLGRYFLLDRIACGGMAEIYRARSHDEEGREITVAIKRVLGHLIEDDEFIQMLSDEAEIAAYLRHPAIAQVFEFARAGNDFFIAMEYVDGKDLRTILERCRAQQAFLPIADCLYVTAEIAAALDVAHTPLDRNGDWLGLIHRDVSPSNVLLGYSGSVKLCDFGIAKGTLSRVQTKTGVIKGKVKYMSPEQAMGRRLDARSDLFSLGSCLYEMLTLQPPFQGGSEMDLIFRVRDAKYKPARELRREIPEDVERLLSRLMARSRGARYQTAEEVRGAVIDALGRIAPGYRRSRLASFLRATFATEIEAELRALDEWEIDQSAPQSAPEIQTLSPISSEKVAPAPRRRPTAPGPALHDRDTEIIRNRGGKPGDEPTTNVVRKRGR